MKIHTNVPCNYLSKLLLPYQHAELCVCAFTVDLNVYKARGDDAAFTVHTIIGVTMLIKEQLLWI